MPLGCKKSRLQVAARCTPREMGREGWKTGHKKKKRTGHLSEYTGPFRKVEAADYDLLI